MKEMSRTKYVFFLGLVWGAGTASFMYVVLYGLQGVIRWQVAAIMAGMYFLVALVLARAARTGGVRFIPEDDDSSVEKD